MGRGQAHTMQGRWGEGLIQSVVQWQRRIRQNVGWQVWVFHAVWTALTQRVKKERKEKQLEPEQSFVILQSLNQFSERCSAQTEDRMQFFCDCANNDGQQFLSEIVSRLQINWYFWSGIFISRQHWTHRDRVGLWLVQCSKPFWLLLSPRWLKHSPPGWQKSVWQQENKVLIWCTADQTRTPETTTGQHRCEVGDEWGLASAELVTAETF